jgi:hypothetical protein
VTGRGPVPVGGSVVLAAAAMASGAALVVTVLTRVSLGLTLLCGALCVAALGWQTSRRLPAAARPVVVERLLAGLLAGLPATGAYDLVRLLVVRVGHLAIWPFDTLPLFGQAILGPGRPPGIVLAVGVCYHYLNGACFSAAYSLLFRHRLFVAGVAWAMGLEIAMLVVYPRWLPALGPVLGEFTVVSLAGHTAFGTVIGLLAQFSPPVTGARPRARAA